MSGQHLYRRQTTVTAVAAFIGIVGALNVGAADLEAEAESLIRRVIAQTTRSGISAQAIRQLEAGTRSGKHQAWMQVETSVNPSGAFTWRVLNEGGSDRTRDKVLRAVLEGEAQAWRAGAADRAALSPDNYTFIPQGENRAGHQVIVLKPKRRDSKLVDGTLTVNADGYPILLQGRLAKSPSFWVKSVTVVKKYGRFAGVSLPVVIESLADVKMFGQSSFTMRYQYSQVNGRPVSHAASLAAPSFGPSAQILALAGSMQ